MTLKINLPENQEETLKAKALAEGVSAEDYARMILARELEPGQTAEPFWKTFKSQMHSLPDEVFEKLPNDGASEHDHYLYGSPKLTERLP